MEGVQNLIQALNLRLNQSLGTRIRLTIYGIKASIGNAANNSASIVYLVTNIKETIMQDPRVKDVFNIKLRGKGDRLYVSFDVISVKIGDTIPFQGVA